MVQNTGKTQRGGSTGGLLRAGREFLVSSGSREPVKVERRLTRVPRVDRSLGDATVEHAERERESNRDGGHAHDVVKQRRKLNRHLEPG